MSSIAGAKAKSSYRPAMRLAAAHMLPVYCSPEFVAASGGVVVLVRHGTWFAIDSRWQHETRRR